MPTLLWGQTIEESSNGEMNDVIDYCSGGLDSDDFYVMMLVCHS